MRLRALPWRAIPALGLIAILTACAGNDVPVNTTPDEVLSHAERKLAEGKYYDAQQALEFLLRSHPGTALTPRARVRLGDAHFGHGEYLLAEGQYQQVVSGFPASGLVEEARFKIARCAYAAVRPFDRDQSETARAVEAFEDFRRDFPESRYLPEVDAAVADCRERLARGEYENGQFYRKHRRYKPAAIQFKHVVNTYGETLWAPKAGLQLAQMYARRERWEEAADWYRRITREWPGTEEAASAGEALLRVPGDTLSRLPETEGDL